MRPHFEAYAAQHGLSARLSFHAGDFFAQALVAFTAARKTLEDCQFQVGRALRAKGPRETAASAAAGGGAQAIIGSSGNEIWDRALQQIDYTMPLHNLLYLAGSIFFCS